MDEVVIIQTLEQACQGLALYFQVIYQQATLYIYINRQPEQVLDYDSLTATVYEAIAALKLPEVQWIALFSRKLGEIEPDWQTTPTPLSCGNLPTEEVLIDKVQLEKFEAHHDGDVLDTETELSIPGEIADTSLSYLQPVTPESREPSQVDNPTTPDLSQYCFVRNKALVTAEVLPPETCVAQLVQTFHELSYLDKQNLLLDLEQFFKTQKLTDGFQDSEAIAQFHVLLNTLSANEVRKAAIWLSRYCYNPEIALEQVSAVLHHTIDQSASTETATVEPVVDATLQQYSAKATRQPESPTATYTAYSATRNRKTSSPKLSWQLLLIPLLWTLFTLGIVCYNVQANNGPGAIAHLCQNAKDHPDYCKLAVQLVGSETFETYSKQTQPSEEKVPRAAMQDCARLGLLNAGATIRDFMQDDHKYIPPTQLSNHEIYPGLFVVDDRQPSIKDEIATVRTACVYATVQSKITQTQQPKLLASEVIPNQWPQEPLPKKPYRLKVADAQSIHGILTVLGTNTLFTAIGLFAVMFLNLGIRIESLNALYAAAFIFGAIDAAFSLIPAMGLFGIIRFTAVPVVGLIVTSMFVKDMEIDFSVGYKVLSMAGGILIGIRLLLNWLLFITILAVV